MTTWPRPGDPPLPSRRARWRRTVLRRVAAGLCLLLALGIAADARADATRTVPVLVAARDVPAGTTLTAADVRTEQRRQVELPAGALVAAREVVGRPTTVAVTASEVLTAARVLGPGALAGLPLGSRVVPVPLLDPATGLVRVGDRVDLYPPGSPAPTTTDTLVVGVLPAGDGGALSVAPSTGSGAVVLVAADEDEVSALAASQAPDAPASGFTVAVRPRGLGAAAR